MTRDITLYFSRVVVLLTEGTDQIHIKLNSPTPFPVMGYEASAKIECAAGYGAEWCKLALGVDPDEVIDTVARRR
jgi:hypothetical protein